MRAPVSTSVAVCAAIVVALSCCFDSDAAELVSRSKRGVVPGNAASRPKDIPRLLPCQNDNACKVSPKTSCGKDPLDGNMRCLCADQTHPINNDCITTPQGFGMPCEMDVQCIQLAFCAHNASKPFPEVKICQCREEFTEDDGTCNGGVRAILSLYLSILVAIVLQNNHN